MINWKKKKKKKKKALFRPSVMTLSTELWPILPGLSCGERFVNKTHVKCPKAQQPPSF